jgi:hypothetical protein
MIGDCKQPGTARRGFETKCPAKRQAVGVGRGEPMKFTVDAAERLGVNVAFWTDEFRANLNLTGS